MKPKLMFYCQHVLGMGHLVRSRELVKGLAGYDVCFVNGGEPIDGFAFPPAVEVVQLPPIASDVEFKGINATDAVREQRREMLMNLFISKEPDVLMIEMFPFGRRKFAFELLPVLEYNAATGRRTRVVSSVRDILVSKRDQDRHEDFACRLLNQFFDLVLVHSDQRFQRLEESFHRTADIRIPVEYTGFVAEQPSPGARSRSQNGTPRVIASIGGGRVGFELLDATIAASKLLDRPHTLSVFTGPYHDDAQMEKLRHNAASASWIEIERFATNFVDLLASADLSLSMGGYNTCMNIVAAGVRSLVFPFTGNGNEEQTIRAHKLENLGLLRVLTTADLDPLALAVRMRTALDAAVPEKPMLDSNGVSNTARSLQQILEAAHV